VREEIVKRYQARYGVELGAEKEAIVTIGAKDALAHLLFAVIGPGDVVVSPNPCYPIHQYGVVMAEGQAAMLAMPDAGTFLGRLEDFYRSWVQKPKLILISFPHNPTSGTRFRGRQAKACPTSAGAKLVFGLGGLP
jgi:alanine-synthesizing transaminase